jgi:hypothetical protein
MQLMGLWPVALPVGAILVPLLAQTALAESRPELSLPLTCEPHRTCFIQTYVDVDPGPGVKDYACGGATYDQHSGVDFRVLSAAVTKSPIPVAAAAEGTVKSIRDGVADIFFKKAKPEDVAGRECGNGVILEHGEGWETQYCHMRKGSLRVAKGQTVKRGEQLGEVGYSGMADFAHVHLTVRHNGKIVDPFLPDAAGGACQRDARGPGLWQPAIAAAFPYRNGEMIAADFAGASPDVNSLEIDHHDVAPLTPASATLVIYGRFINLLKGDRVRFVAAGPEGAILDETTVALARGKANFVAFAGKRRGKDTWRTGHYTGRVELIRDAGVIATSIVALDLN